MTDEICKNHVPCGMANANEGFLKGVTRYLERK